MCGLLASGESMPPQGSRDMELKNKLLREPGEKTLLYDGELALNGEDIKTDGLRSVIVLYGLRGVPLLLLTRSSDSCRMIT